MAQTSARSGVLAMQLVLDPKPFGEIYRDSIRPLLGSTYMYHLSRYLDHLWGWKCFGHRRCSSGGTTAAQKVPPLDSVALLDSSGFLLRNSNYVTTFQKPYDLICIPTIEIHVKFLNSNPEEDSLYECSWCYVCCSMLIGPLTRST